ncbi:hypothetical protein CDCA_CDCA19G4737 [Cyanidium caldarium]|uniref:Cupin type-1 domain-containing protein n=1 Tax=Cyanidium caldarium TaxID=2771 RepID=A0AAV9J285_CYACA|nr:hypothetical protein CDCA_CDCA19G4737 [Cyanidium caldarium]
MPSLSRTCTLLFSLLAFTLACRIPSAYAKAAGTAAEFNAAPASAFVKSLPSEGVTLVSTAAGSIKGIPGTVNPLLLAIDLSTFIFTLKHCSQLELHVHTNGIEYNYIVSGSGSFSLWSSNGSIVHLKTTLHPGDVVIIPAGWPHMFSGPENFPEPLVMEVTFTSANPQTYFVAGAGSFLSVSPGYVMASEFNATVAQYETFFGLAKSGGIVFNETCVATSRT